MDNSRVSISIHRTESAGGEIETIDYLSSGKKLHIAYTHEYLRRHGAVSHAEVRNIYIL